MTAVRVGQGVVGAARLRMAGRGDVAVLVCDEPPPAIVGRDGWTAHEAHVVTGAVPSRDVVVPFDPALAGVRARRLGAYIAGRYCATRALWAAGQRVSAVPVGDAGAPRWPAGVVGSISHTETRALAAVGSAARWRGMGVDCEPVLAAAAADEIGGVALAEADAVDVTGAGALTWAEFVTVGFSAKESLYKCLRPIVRRFFDFGDAHLIAVDRDTRRVRVRLVRDLAPGFARDTVFEIAFAIADAHVYTCLALPAIAGSTAPEYDL